jgi:trehalose 6-phosphate phosphatase
VRHILSRHGLAQLATFARDRVLLAFDFDGTLAPTVADRHQAQMRDQTRALFERLCRVYPCVVISGRSRRDVRARLQGALIRDVVGNHGLEPSRSMRPFGRRIALVRGELEAALKACSGLEIEDKGYSLAIHYRLAPETTSARRRIHAAISRVTAAIRVVPGKLVVNVVPAGAPHKGDALLQLWRRSRAQRALYIGDDVTDEDAFGLDGPGHLLAIRVGTSRSSAAGYYLRRQREMDALLAHLSELRSQGSWR